MATQNHINVKNICSSGLNVQATKENCALSLRVVTSILGNVPKIVPSCFFPVFSATWSKLPASCDNSEVSNWAREDLCVYIWSQICLMHKEEEWTTFTHSWLPQRCQVRQV